MQHQVLPIIQSPLNSQQFQGKLKLCRHSPSFVSSFYLVPLAQRPTSQTFRFRFSHHSVPSVQWQASREKWT
jgi:hypothetical protein